MDLSAANGHLQAVGRDARGRKQYRYHPKWRETRDETKFGRMRAFSEALPAIRRRVESDLARPGLPREKVLATLVRLLEVTGIRVGNDEYARANRSFGLTTLLEDHVEVSGSTMRFKFRGKSGKVHTASFSDRRLARIVQRCQALPGEDLFQYLDADGVEQTVGSGDVNDYLREITGEDFTAKDFRTWTGTTLAARRAQEIGPSPDEREAKSAIVRAIDRVAEQLEQHESGVPEILRAPDGLRALPCGDATNGKRSRRHAQTGVSDFAHPDERAVVRLLDAQAKLGRRQPP